MSDFSMGVALIWARANAATSVGMGPLDFAKSVAAIATEVKRLTSPTKTAAEDPESETTGKPNPPRPPCSPDAAVHNMPAAPSGPCDCGAQIKLVLESIKHALVMHGNCWITDVPEHPRVESLGWMTEFTREIKAIDDALLFLDETGRKHREYRRCSTDLLTEPQAGPSKCEQEHSGSRTPSEDCL